MIHHDKPFSDTIMPTISFGKRQRVAYIAGHALTERMIPALLMGRLTGLFADTTRSFPGKHGLIGAPKVAVAGALTKCGWNPMPQASTGAFTVVANHKGQNVTGPSQQDGPEPACVDPFPDKTPGFIDFQHVLRLRGRERLLQRGQGVKFFFDPAGQRVPGDAEDAADAAQTGPFLVGSENVFLAFRAIGLFRGQDPNGAAVFAEILLTAALISSIFHNVCAAACATLMLNRGHDHLTLFFEDDFFDKKIRASFIVYHYLILMAHTLN